MSATGLDCAPRRATPAPAGLARRAFGGFAWMLAQNVVARGVAFASQLALAALLAPADFGLIGLAYSVTAVAQALTDIGIEDVLLQRRERMTLWSGPAFAITLALLSVAALVVAGVAPFAARAYHAPRLLGLLLILAASMPFASFSIVPGAVLRASLRFRFLAGWGAFEAVALASLTVAGAAAGAGAYSFVLPLPLLAVVRAAVWYPMARATMPLSFRPRPRRWRFLIGNSAVTLGTRLCMAISGQSGYAVLGLMASENVVGRYYFGFRLAAQPVFVLAGNVAGVLLPALVQIKDDKRRQGAAALSASRMLSTCVMPLAFGQAAVAAPLIGHFFGARWAAAIPIIEILSVAIAFDAVSWLAGALLGARGEFKAQFVNQAAQLPVFVALVAIGARLDGALGTAIGTAIYYVTTQPLFVWTVFRRLGLGMGDVASIYLRPASFAALSALAGLALAQRSLPTSMPVAIAAATLAVQFVVFLALLRTFDPTTWRELRERTRSFARR